MAIPVFSDRIWSDVESLRPLALRETFSFPFDPDRAAPVYGLLFSCCPSAVFFLVGAVVVDAVQRLTTWGFTHIGQKLLKVVDPRWRDGDTAATVVGKRLRARIQTAIFHLDPRGIFPRITATVGDLALPKLNAKAAAGAGIAFTQIMTADDGFLAAFATATPPSDTFGPCRSGRAFNDEQTSERVVGKIHRSHQWILSLLE